MQNNSGIENIMTRASVRSYQEKAVAEVLGLLESLVPFNTIVIGYPASQVTPKDKWDEHNVIYNKITSMQ